MARRPVPVLIRQYAQRLNLDPRAVGAVAMGEGGLRWGAVGDGGHAFGPFQMNDAGGVLTNRFGSPERRAAFANSEAGVWEAMSAMAQHARGLRGRAAIEQIVSKYERPADIPGSIAKATGRYGSVKLPGVGTVPTPNDPSVPSSPVFGVGAGTGPDVAGQRQAVVNFLLSRATARRSGQQAPGIGNLIGALAAARQTGAGELTEGLPTEPGNNLQPQHRNPRFGSDVPTVIRAGQYAKKLGLSVRENPYFDPVDPVHTEGSDHYKTVGRYGGRAYGAALDVSGNPQRMKQYFQWLQANRQGLKLDDLFHDPMGYSFDEGKLWKKTIGGHGGHVHASFN